MRSSRSCGATGPGSAPCDHSWVMPCAHDQQVAARRSASTPGFHPAVCASMMHVRNEAYAAPAASMSAGVGEVDQIPAPHQLEHAVVRDAVRHVRAPVPGEARERFGPGRRACLLRAPRARPAYNQPALTDSLDGAQRVALVARAWELDHADHRSISTS